MVSILYLVFGVTVLILYQCNMACYLEGVVIGRDILQVSLNSVPYVSVVRPYLYACTIVYDKGLFYKNNNTFKTLLC